MFHVSCLCFFFFQAEDGIRDRDVTEFRRVLFRSAGSVAASFAKTRSPGSKSDASAARRSEERRVGKGVDLGGRRIIKKKKKQETKGRKRKQTKKAEGTKEQSKKEKN